MTEQDARDRVAALVSPQALDRITAFVDLVRSENERQNLVAKPTLDSMWLRHVLDSAQLLPLAADATDGAWIDVGTGAGFPGIIVAMATERETLLVEPRRMRAEFLQAAVDRAGIGSHTRVIQSRIERVSAPEAAVISARAVASARDLFTSTRHLASDHTLYLLPKGQSATTDAVDAQRAFAGTFHVEQSLTDPASGIIVARKVRARR